jgi:Domain of unknown function (DUF4160)
MARLHTIGSVIITVYANDHLPFHFHVVHPDFEALIEIETLDYYAGEIPPAFRKEVMEWVAANLDVIKAEWNRINRFKVK